MKDEKLKVKVVQRKAAAFLRGCKPFQGPTVVSEKNIIAGHWTQQELEEPACSLLGRAQPPGEGWQSCHLLPWTALLSLRREWERAPLGTSLLPSLSSPSSSHAAEILLQSHSLTRPLQVALCWCWLLQLTCVCLTGLFAQNVAMLTILVQDVNEEPVFLNNAYSARIPNSVPYKYPVITVEVQYLFVLFMRTDIFWKIWGSSTVKLG